MPYFLILRFQLNILFLLTSLPWRGFFHVLKNESFVATAWNDLFVCYNTTTLLIKSLRRA